MTVLLTHYPDLYRERIIELVEQRYGITNAQFSFKFINSLPYGPDGYEVTGLSTPIITDYWGIQDSGVVRVDDVEDISLIADAVASQYIKPQVTWTDDLPTAIKWLNGIEAKYPMIAVDFEARDLTLPQFNELTMVTISWSRTKSIVIVFKDQSIQDYVLNWLVTTNCKQVFHNSLFDVRFIHWHTKQLPKHIEDSQLLVAVCNNNVDQAKRKSGLKEVSKFPYLDWANDKSSFELYVDSSDYSNPNLTYVGPNPNTTQYNLPLIYYCGVDACATHHAWLKYDTEPAHPTEWIPQTSEPRYNTEQFNQRYYYEFILKPAIPVIVEMLNAGQAIDLTKVSTLEQEVLKFNEATLAEINSIQIVQDFHATVDPQRIEKFLEPIRKAWKEPQYTGFKANPKMRAFVVNHLTGSTYETLSDKELKLIDDPVLQPLKDKLYNDQAIVAASNEFAESEALRQNTAANRVDKINHPEKYIQIGFNPWNYQQLKHMWLSFGLESYKVSKDTGEMSFDSKVLQELSKTTTGDPQRVIKLYLEIAQSKNMITQYIPKYYGSTYEGRLHYALKLMGTFTGRLSGKAGSDNMDAPMKHQCGANGVTQPVGHRVYGKTVKSMFIAPPGRILVAVDYNGLENHINACLTKDKTTIKLLSPDPDTGLMWDMHTLHSTIFFKEQWEQLTGKPFENTIQYNNMCYALTDTDPIADKLRSLSKPITFKLAYGGFPDDHKGGTITQEIFDRYHTELYPGVTEFKEDYVIPTANEQGYLHLNWGLRLYSDNPKSDLLSINNANFQGYSDLTLIAGINFRKLYLSKGNPHNITGLNIIHDALYYEIDNTVEAIKWVNDNLIPTMTPDFLHNQTVHLRAEMYIGFNQKSMVTLPNNASIDVIQSKLKEL